MNNFSKNLFSPKKNPYEDIFERTKYLLSFRLTLYLSFALLILSIILLLFFTKVHFILTSIGFVTCLLSHFYIRKTGKFQTFIIIFNLIGAFLCIFTLLYVKDQPRIVDGLWMVISSMFSFLTLGKRWGTIITITHGLVLSFFFFFFLNDQIILLREMKSSHILGFSVNVLICFSIIYYLNWQNIKSTKDAENELKEAKHFLEKQFELINIQNDEKTILLKEVHHRVKNNLQVIVSLLRLQTREIKNENELKNFNESINRVLAMALIHEKIYQTEDFSHIDLKDYFTTLANDMIRSFQVEKHIEFKIDCEVSNFGLKPIVPVALIFNELFSNSIKYAFENIDEPQINVQIIEKDENFIDFIYSDNGRWKETKNHNTFGLELIETLTEQLGGNVNVEKTSGTKYHFYFDKLNA